MRQLTVQEANLLRFAGVSAEDICVLMRYEGAIDAVLARIDRHATAMHALRRITREYMDIRDLYNLKAEELSDAVDQFNLDTGSNMRFDENESYPVYEFKH